MIDKLLVMVPSQVPFSDRKISCPPIVTFVLRLLFSGDGGPNPTPVPMSLTPLQMTWSFSHPCLGCIIFEQSSLKWICEKRIMKGNIFIGIEFLLSGVDLYVSGVEFTLNGERRVSRTDRFTASASDEAATLRWAAEHTGAGPGDEVTRDARSLRRTPFIICSDLVLACVFSVLQVVRTTLVLIPIQYG